MSPCIRCHRLNRQNNSGPAKRVPLTGPIMARRRSENLLIKILSLSVGDSTPAAKAVRVLLADLFLLRNPSFPAEVGIERTQDYGDKKESQKELHLSIISSAHNAYP